jgi:hypothetical protein
MNHDITTRYEVIVEWNEFIFKFAKETRETEQVQVLSHFVQEARNFTTWTQWRLQQMSSNTEQTAAWFTGGF